MTLHQKVINGKELIMLLNFQNCMSDVKIQFKLKMVATTKKNCDNTATLSFYSSVYYFVMNITKLISLFIYSFIYLFLINCKI
jgi:hypothetical protein